MSERVAQTDAKKRAKADIGRSPDQIASLRLAAVLIAANVAQTIVVAFALSPRRMPFIQVGVGLFMAYYVYTLRPRAEALALGVSVLAAILLPLAYLATRLPVDLSVLESIPAWGTVGALLLLLTGDPRLARRMTALALFCFFNVGFHLLAVLLRLGRFAAGAGN
jgi:hypothetical protein